MSDDNSFKTAGSISFGPFTLRVAQRLLERDGVPVDLGGRAMDVLLALVANANTVVNKRELMALAWPGMVVSDGSLRYQIAMLRHRDRSRDEEYLRLIGSCTRILRRHSSDRRAGCSRSRSPGGCPSASVA